MADVKISGLPASTTPLAGTEVLPIVQGGQTRQVSVNNLTTGKSVSATNFIPSGSTIPTNGVYLPAANSVGIATNSTNAIYVNATQQVGIGTATPRTRLNVAAATSNFPALGTANDGAIIGAATNNFGLNVGVSGTGNTWMQAMRFDGTATSYTLFAQPSGGKFNIGGATSAFSYTAEIAGTPDTNRASTRSLLNLYNSTGAFSTSPYSGLTFTGIYDSAGNATDLAFIGGGKENATDNNFAGYLKFNTRANGSADIVERMRITSAGDVNLATGNLVIGTSGKGIDFSATPGTGTSELLADYEEGTWTPASGVGTATGASGVYTKVGRSVTVIGTLTFPVQTDAGLATITGLPFTSGTTASGGTLRYTTFGSAFFLYGTASSTTIECYNTAGTGQTYTQFSGRRVDFAMTYFV